MSLIEEFDRSSVGKGTSFEKAVKALHQSIAGRQATDEARRGFPKVSLPRLSFLEKQDEDS